VPVLCLGEALVDLICERPVANIGEADAFVPHFGGAVANAAVAAAAVGADVALAGGAGDDAWGGWLEDELGESGVELEWFERVPGTATPVAFITVDAAGEPTYQLYGDSIAAAIESIGPRLDSAVEVCDALFFSSNTLASATERDVTMAARERALALGRPVLFDPNVRTHRWDTATAAAAAANACIPGATLVRCNRAEAELLTGEPDPEAAARSLLKAGAGMVVITLGADGAMLRGELRADVPGRPVEMVNAAGAGDMLMGVLVGRLSQAGFYPPAVPAALPEAVEAAAAACERWGAVA
jgi:sugar/nucleoside kinase (ribokinase family)